MVVQAPNLEEERPSGVRAALQWIIAVPTQNRIVPPHFQDADFGIDGSEEVPQCSNLCMPELVSVVMDYPLGTMINHRRSGHAGEPVGLRISVVPLREMLDFDFTRQRLDDLRRPVFRQIVHDNKAIDALLFMEPDIVLEQVFLVADQKGHGDFHGVTTVIGTAQRLRDKLRSLAASLSHSGWRTIAA